MRYKFLNPSKHRVFIAMTGMLLAVQSLSAFADELVATKSGSSPLPINPYIDVSGGRLAIVEKPNKASRFVSVSVGFGYSVNEDLSLDLSQGIEYSPDREDELHDPLQFDVMVLAANQKLFEHKLYGLRSSLSLGGIYYRSKLDAISTRRASAYANLPLGIKVTNWLSLGITPGFSKYFYRDEFSNSDYGEANSNYRYSLGSSATLSYKKVAFSSSYTNFRTIKYAGWEDSYAYLFRTRLSYTWDNHFSGYLMMDTTNSQIENDHLTAIAMFDRDVTTISGGLTYSM